MKKLKKSKKRLMAGQESGEANPKEEKKLSKTFWMSVFICAIMILSVMGYVGMDKGTNSKMKYKNFSLTVTEDNKWSIKLDGQNILFYSHPEEVSPINMSPEAAQALKAAKMVYVTSDENDLFKDAIGLVEFELKDVMEKKGVYFVYSFTGQNSFNKTVMTCSNSTSAVPVIYLRQWNETGISYANNCIILNAQSEQDMLRLRDRLLYGFFGVI